MVAEPLAHDEQRDPSRQADAGVAVAQPVKPDARQSRGGDQGLEGVAQRLRVMFEVDKPSDTQRKKVTGVFEGLDATTTAVLAGLIGTVGTVLGVLVALEPTVIIGGLQDAATSGTTFELEFTNPAFTGGLAIPLGAFANSSPGCNDNAVNF